MLTVKPAFSGARRVCGSGSARKASPVSRPPPHSSNQDSLLCVGPSDTGDFDVPWCLRPPHPVSPLPGVRGESQERRGEPHPVKKAPVPPPSRPQLNDSRGGEREVLAGVEGGRGGRSSRTPACPPSPGSCLHPSRSSGRGRPRGGGAGCPGAGLQEHPGCREVGCPSQTAQPPVYPSAPALEGRSKVIPLASVRSRLRPAPVRPRPLTRFLTSAESP